MFTQKILPKKFSTKKFSPKKKFHHKNFHPKEFSTKKNFHPKIFTQNISFFSKYSIVRLSFVDLRWAQLYVSLVSYFLFFYISGTEAHTLHRWLVNIKFHLEVIIIPKIFWYFMFYNILYFLKFFFYISGAEAHTQHIWLGNIKFHLKVIKFKRWRSLTELTTQGLLIINCWESKWQVQTHKNDMKACNPAEKCKIKAKQVALRREAGLTKCSKRAGAPSSYPLFPR